MAIQSLIQSTQLTLFALVDGLQYERFCGEELSAQQGAVPLFDRWPDSRIAFAGPWIIGMSQVMAMREQLEALEQALPAVSWLVSATTQAELVGGLQKNLNTGLPGGRAALLRFHDPRVQFRLAAGLNSLQHRELTGLTREWLTTLHGRVWSFKQRDFLC